MSVFAERAFLILCLRRNTKLKLNNLKCIHVQNYASVASKKLNDKLIKEHDIGYVVSKRFKPIKIGENIQIHKDKFKEPDLISKGWAHNKSVGDFFNVQPVSSKEYDVPKHDFNEILGQDNGELLARLNDLNVHYATDFQKEAIQCLNQGKNCILSAETGCGKTLAYLLPLCQKLVLNKKLNNEEEEGHANELNTPKAVILVPNRELAQQIGNVATKLTENLGLNVDVIIGGKTKRTMLNPEFKKVDILVSTPGVLGKLSTVGIYRLGEVEYAIFDECDTLLDESFAERITMILSRIGGCQLALVGATLPQKIPEAFNTFTFQYVTSNRLHKPLLHVQQKFLRLQKSVKPMNLLKLANKQGKEGRMIVFSNRNETAGWVALFLRENGIQCSLVNGDMNAELRAKEWTDFCKGHTKILSATDVVSRGLDTVDTQHVLNYDFPLYSSDYIHRVGRVGRLSNLIGAKITNFITNPREIQLVQQIEMAIRTNSEIPYVDGNITRQIKQRIVNQLGEN